MAERVDLLILGASARAAAFSALRAGLRPWCADLFADADLRERCPAVRLAGGYPDGFADLLELAPEAPWMYTGGLENHPPLVTRLAKMRPLWGNNAAALNAVRDPVNVAPLLHAARLPAPRSVREFGYLLGASRWLVKPLRGAGGIRFYYGEKRESLPARSYLQEFIEGEARSVLYVAGIRDTRLLGVTRQLVGETWLHAAPFQYCGSVGPIALSPNERAELKRLGSVLANGCGLRGLFGIDGIWKDGVFWPVEVNPRYTASVEVLEYATGLAALAWHRQAFDPASAALPDAADSKGVIGKAILFARETIVFPQEGRWDKQMQNRVSVQEMPDFADLPDAGQRIEARRPVLTFFTRAADVDSCLEALVRTAVRVIQSVSV